MTILIVLMILSSSILLSLISYQRAKSSLVVQLEDNYMASAQKYSLELAAWISNNATIIDTLAAEIAVNDITFTDYETFHNYLIRSNELLNKNGYVYDIYFTYPNNTMVCASDFIADGSVDFVHEREWYTTSALTGELYYSTPYIDSDTKKPVITISKAVFKDEKLLGVLAADIFVDVLMNMIDNADFGENSYVFLFDQNQRMLVHPNKAYEYDSTPKKVMDIPECPYSTLLDVIGSKEDKMVFVEDFDGIRRGIATAQMPNTGWYVNIAMEEKDIAKGVGSLIRGFVVSTIISIVIGAFIAIFLARVLDKLSLQEQEYKQQVLRLEKQAADEASKAKSRFLADMSHEIRTPINAIIGMNEMILRESDDKDIRSYALNISQSGHNLLQLINGILDFSKIEDGKMEIVPVSYNVGAQVAYLMNSISDRAAAKNLRLEFNISPGLPRQLYGDDTRINQVIINLLTNAVKYTEKGQVVFTVDNKEKKDGMVRISYEVKDTGIGIRQEDMDKLFESFERLDVVRNRNIEGTGLGMAITSRLLDLMDSRLNIKSEYGQGSIFSFELWQRIEDETPLGDYRQALKAVNEKGAYKESFHAPKALILAVDDTKMNLVVVESLLKKTLVKIDTACSGPDSIELAGRNAYDLILMDQRMPGMDGTEAMKRIRAVENGPNKNTPVICLTADVIRGARDRYLEQGFDDYLTKPIDGAELEDMLLTYLPKEKVERIKIAQSDVSGHDAGDETAGIAAGDTPAGGGMGDMQVRDQGNLPQDGPDSELTAALEAAGVDTRTGMMHSNNDAGIYTSVLGSFASEHKEKSTGLTDSFKARDLKNYGILIHSVKSSSAMIGAAELSALAADLEAAAKNEDFDTVMKGHERVMEMYSQLAEVINDHVDNAQDGGEDDEILEFEPEA